MANPFYEHYIRSDRWLRRRAQFLSAVGEHCSHCGTTRRIQVHHVTYDRLGDELDSDLIALCAGCHKFAHDTNRENPHLTLELSTMLSSYLGRQRPRPHRRRRHPSTPRRGHVRLIH